MAYTQNVPQATQRISTTQPIIEANFQFLQTALGEEHNFNAGGTGSDMYHLQASMPNLGGAPALPSGTDGMYYVESANARFWDGTTVCKMTEGSAVALGYQYLGRVLMQWGVIAPGGTLPTSGTVTFNTPFASSVFNIQMTLIAPGGGTSTSNTISPRTGSITTSQFTYNYTGTTSYVGFYWMAIGI